MDEQDIVARLSRALDTQSVALTDEGTSTHEMLNKLSEQINELHDEATGDGDEYDEYDDYNEGYDDSRVELPNRPTPYEVWATKNEVTKIVKPPKVMKDEEWDGLVERLHGTKRSKESTIKQQQNRELAEQLRELHFKPTLNDNSRRIAADTKRGPMLRRMEMDLEVREKKLQQKREEQADEEIKELQPKPNLEGSKQSLKYLKQANKPTSRTVEDIMQYGEETKLRRLQRKQIMEELENRELTFTPQLNRASLLLQEKMRREGRSTYCKDSGQTHTRHKNGKARATMTNADPGHEDETFHPQIHTKTKLAKRSDGKSAHERLYDNAHEVNVKKHNEQVALLENFTKGMPLKATEQSKRDRSSSSATWVQDRKLSKTGKAGTSAPAQFLNTLEYSPSLDFILERLNAAQAAQA
eukprot:CAMPEP_0119466226 /NCGR_PEP_ID=MMETSP1344-20130328/982_1 /TAXON_ID=236787 /ORGANISM="Florenciella parvula, Strain CCMP2471" /LENGTH=412 /DNA_ID=CAMNT_0007498527 /DNA_START=293 /DNA_END=1531 /DNA_ORIENTATION=+